MNKLTTALCGLAFLTGSIPGHAADNDKSKDLDRLSSAESVLNEIMATPDKGIPQTILAGASCVVVVPSEERKQHYVVWIKAAVQAD